MTRQLFALLALLSLGAAAHPLDGRWWDVRAQQFIDAATVQTRAADAQFVLLGEQHDSALHHAEQLALLRALAGRGWRGALAMEQFDHRHQEALSAAQQAGTRDAEQLADAGRLDRQGWRWPLYQELIAFAAAQGWPLLAANLSRAEGRAIALGAPGPDLPPADPAQQAAIEADVIRGHCGQRPEPERLAGIVRAQRARDARLAATLSGAGAPAVLIAGAGHVRSDRAVPRYLPQPAAALAIAYVETETGWDAPTHYPLSGFDLVRFTAPTARPDPCAVPLTGSVATTSAPKESP